MTLREERAAKVRALKDQGLHYREIMARLGMARGTVFELLCDPDGSKLKARKDSYRGVCRECGKRTHGSNGVAKAPAICASCKEWTEDEIISAIQRWADEHGCPPTTADWRKAQNGYPSARPVIDRIGWNEALLRAGFGLWSDRRPETQTEIERLARMEKLRAKEIGERVGLNDSAVIQRLHSRGLTLTALRQEMS